jgi:hypothetical protein
MFTRAKINVAVTFWQYSQWEDFSHSSRDYQQQFDDKIDQKSDIQLSREVGTRTGVLNED